MKKLILTLLCLSLFIFPNITSAKKIAYCEGLNKIFLKCVAPNELTCEENSDALFKALMDKGFPIGTSTTLTKICYQLCILAKLDYQRTLQIIKDLKKTCYEKVEKLEKGE